MTVKYLLVASAITYLRIKGQFLSSESTLYPPRIQMSNTWLQNHMLSAKVEVRPWCGWSTEKRLSLPQKNMPKH